MQRSSNTGGWGSYTRDDQGPVVLAVSPVLEEQWELYPWSTSKIKTKKNLVYILKLPQRSVSNLQLQYEIMRVIQLLKSGNWSLVVSNVIFHFVKIKTIQVQTKKLQVIQFKSEKYEIGANIFL